MDNDQVADAIIDSMEMECKSCSGTGLMIWFNGKEVECNSCEGLGTKLTDLGRAIINLVRKYT